MITKKRLRQYIEAVYKWNKTAKFQIRYERFNFGLEYWMFASEKTEYDTAVARFNYARLKGNQGDMIEWTAEKIDWAIDQAVVFFWTCYKTGYTIDEVMLAIEKSRNKAPESYLNQLQIWNFDLHAGAGYIKKLLRKEFDSHILEIAFERIIASNNSKFEKTSDGEIFVLKDAGGKVQKWESYFAPNLLDISKEHLMLNCEDYDSL